MHLLLLATCIWGAYESALTLAFEWARYSTYQEIGRVAYKDLSMNEKIERLGRLQTVSDYSRATAASHYITAKFAWKMIQDKKLDWSAKEDLTCTVLRNLTAARNMQSRNYRFLLFEAQVRQILGRVSCGSLTRPLLAADDYRTLVSKALEYAPNTPEALIWAAAIYANEGSEGDKLTQCLRRFLELSSQPEPAQMEFLLTQIKTHQDVEAIVPPLLPHASHVAQAMMRMDVSRFERLQEAFEEVLRKGLENFLVEESSKQENATRISVLQNLIKPASGTKLRPKVDEELAREFRRLGRKRLAEYFSSRASLTKLDIVPGILHRDNRPEKRMASHWGERGWITFDDTNNSLVFYLGEGQLLERIELTSAKGALAHAQSRVELWVSRDNQSWQRGGYKSLTSIGDVNERHILVLSVEPSNYPYWKVHFASSSKERQFVNTLDELVIAYGVKKGRAQ